MSGGACPREDEDSIPIGCTIHIAEVGSLSYDFFLFAILALLTRPRRADENVALIFSEQKYFLGD